jgi:hypothetical protein
LEDLTTDISLGRATRTGYRNRPKMGDETKVFGVKTIRDDLAKSVNLSLGKYIVSIFVKELWK